MRNRIVATLILIAGFQFLDTTALAVQQSFSNTAPITIPASGSAGVANPYSSNIAVASVGGSVDKVTVMLNGINHTCPPDLDILLQGPGGQKTLLMSDCATCGGGGAVNVSVGFDDSAASELPQAGAGQLLSGVFRPTNSNPSGDSGDLFPSPAPIGPYVTSLSVFNGADPNGTWKLFVVDDTSADIGNIASGWTLTLSTVPEPSSALLASLSAIGLMYRRTVRRLDHSPSN